MLSQIALERIRGADWKLATSTGTPCRCKERAIGRTMRGMKPKIRTGRFTGLPWFGLGVPAASVSVPPKDSLNDSLERFDWRLETVIQEI